MYIAVRSHIEMKQTYLLNRFFFQNVLMNGSVHLFFIHLYIYFLATPCSMWDLSSSTRDQTCTPCVGSTESTTGPPGKSLDFFFFLI